MYTKVQAHSSSETAVIKSRPHAFDESRPMTFLTILGFTETLCSLRLALERKMCKEMSEPPKLLFLEKNLVNSFAISDVEVNTPGPLNGGVIAEFSLWIPLLAIHKNSLEPNF